MTLLNKVITYGAAAAASLALAQAYQNKLDKFSERIQQVETLEDGEKVAEELGDDCEKILFDYYEKIGYNKGK